MAETFDWLKPSLLWQPGATDMLRRGFFRPALHEFTTDKFMEDFLAAAAAAAPQPLSDTLAKAPAGRTTLKFFQPVHGNFYLTSASLCCHVPGFPDREVLTGEGESVFFVLRKKIKGVEHAWDAGEANRGWHPLDDPRAVPEGEERLPLYQARTGQGRQIFFGYVPVSSQDTYAAAVTALLPDDHRDDLRLHELDARFIGPLAMTTVNDGSTPFESPGRVADPDVQLRVSVYMLLDLWEYLDQYLPEVAAALRDGTTSQLTGAAGDLANYLFDPTRASFGGTSLTLGAALHEVANDRAALNQPGDADLVTLGYTNNPSNPSDFTSNYNLNANKLTGLTEDTRLRGRVKAALEESPETDPGAAPLPKFAPTSGGDLTEPADRYVVRYVYERAQCDPPHLHVSRPTKAFELAPFFDPDAPGRNIRVGLPVDVSIAGLRKFKKNVGFIMSKELNRKLDSLKGQEKATLDNEASASEDFTLDIGWICSFSLPIITLCAFILLMIIVIVLNLVFWWIPLLKICFPIPLIAKK